MIELKVIKKWNDNEFYVEISAEFVSKGDSYLDDDWERVYYDIVNLEGKVFNGEVDPVGTFTDVAKSHAKTVEYRWFKDNVIRTVSIQEDFIDKFSKMTDCCENKIKNIRRSKEITDGLPDSLIGL